MTVCSRFGQAWSTSSKLRTSRSKPPVGSDSRTSASRLRRALASHRTSGPAIVRTIRCAPQRRESRHGRGRGPTARDRRPRFLPARARSSPLPRGRTRPSSPRCPAAPGGPSRSFGRLVPARSTLQRTSAPILFRVSCRARRVIGSVDVRAIRLRRPATRRQSSDMAFETFQLSDAEDARRTILEGVRRGRKAAWLPQQH